MTLGFAAVLKIWKKAVQLLEDDDFRGALSSFESIPSTPIPGLASARILFNIGCIHTTLGDYQTAYKKLTETVEKDEHMAIGYFQRGCVLNKLSRISEAEEDFMKCRQLIRKDVIDYTQLGLWRQLYACEALYNAGIQASKQNLLTKAIDNLLQASKLVTKEKHACINEALKHADQNPQGIKALPLLELVATDIFRPPKDKSDVSVREHDFLGKAKVVASKDTSDIKTGFQGRHLMSSDSGSDMDGAPRLPPRTSSHQVKRDTRQPATNSKNQPPAPPTGPPPPRPVSRKMVTVELTCNSKCKLQIEANSRLSLMVQRACEQFDLPSNSIQLWFQSNGEYTCIDSEDLMQKVWFREVKNGHLSLWCFGKQ